MNKGTVFGMRGPAVALVGVGLIFFGTLLPDGEGFRFIPSGLTPWELLFVSALSQWGWVALGVVAGSLALRRGGPHVNFLRGYALTAAALYISTFFFTLTTGHGFGPYYVVTATGAVVLVVGAFRSDASYSFAGAGARGAALTLAGAGLVILGTSLPSGVDYILFGAGSDAIWGMIAHWLPVLSVAALAVAGLQGNRGAHSVLGPWTKGVGASVVLYYLSTVVQTAYFDSSLLGLNHLVALAGSILLFVGGMAASGPQRAPVGGPAASAS